MYRDEDEPQTKSRGWEAPTKVKASLRSNLLQKLRA